MEGPSGESEALETDGEDPGRYGRRGAQEQLEKKDELLAMLGHELRNPLASIRSSLYILAQRAATEEQSARARETIDRQVTHLTHLVDDLLDISRLSRGKVVLRKQRLDLAVIVRSAVDDYRPAIAAAGLDVELDVADGTCVHVDPVRLSQVIGNVLHNAVKFTEPGGHLKVTLCEEGQLALLSIVDSGVGMDRETLALLFEPFSQAERGIDRSGGGLGLGLTLVKQLVEMHGGTVEAHSQGAHMGTRIDVRIPLDHHFEAPPIPIEERAESRGRRCLVIEDNPDAAESMGLLLELSGHQVEIAADGRKGLEAARRFRPDVVLCDIGLPGGMDGYEVARQMREDPLLSQARLIALTGYGQEEDQRRAREAGFDIHLTKPADPVMLGRLLTDPS